MRMARRINGETNILVTIIIIVIIIINIVKMIVIIIIIKSWKLRGPCW